MAATFTASSMVLSMGIFFSLMVVGLASSLPHALFSGLTAQGVPASEALKVSKLPPVGTLFASFLGYNPVKTLLATTLAHMPHAKAAYLTGRSFFPHLISSPFRDGVHEAFDFAALACFVAAIASWFRGTKYHHGQDLAKAHVPGQAATTKGAGRARAVGRPGPGDELAPDDAVPVDALVTD